jgi:hypothetical protein
MRGSVPPNELSVRDGLPRHCGKGRRRASRAANCRDHRVGLSTRAHVLARSRGQLAPLAILSRRSAASSASCTLASLKSWPRRDWYFATDRKSYILRCWVGRSLLRRESTRHGSYRQCMYVRCAHLWLLSFFSLDGAALSEPSLGSCVVLRHFASIDVTLSRAFLPCVNCELVFSASARLCRPWSCACSPWRHRTKSLRIQARTKSPKLEIMTKTDPISYNVSRIAIAHHTGLTSRSWTTRADVTRTLQ